MAGAGKSTLLRHLAWWWQRTGLVDQVFAFSYEDRAWTASQIIREIRSKLLSPVEQARADTMPASAQLEQVAQLLRATRHLLILDNAESITATPAAIPHALDPAEQAQLKTLLSRLRGGQTLVLIGSREAETWLAAGSFGENTYPLPGLDPQAASVLVDRILARHGATHYLEDKAERDALQEIVDLLNGYPLPLTVVLPILASAPLSVVLTDLKGGRPGADPTGLIGRAIESSHGKLNAVLQNSLLLLAPFFTSVIPTDFLLKGYRDLLVEHEAVQSLGSFDLPAAINQAITVGLATPHPQLTGKVQVQPVLPYFLRSRLHQQQALQAATGQAHFQLYSQLALALGGMLRTPENPQQRAIAHAVAHAEYANLVTALAHGLRTSQPISSLIHTLGNYLEQCQQQETFRQLLDEAIASYPDPTGPDQHIELAYLHEFAIRTAIDQYRLDDAKVHAETALRLLQAIGDRRRQSIHYHQLGRVAREQRRYNDAKLTTTRPSKSIWNTATNPPQPTHTSRWASSINTSGAIAKPKPAIARLSEYTCPTATITAQAAPTTISASWLRTKSIIAKPKPTISRPSISPWNTATSTAPPSRTMSSGPSPTCRSAITKPKNVTARPSTSI